MRINDLVNFNSFSNMSDAAFATWRRLKLRRARDAEARFAIVTIADPNALTDEERHALLYSIDSIGYALYKVSDCGEGFAGKELLSLSAQLGLTHLDRNRCAYEDGVSRIQNDVSGERKHYIPYSNKALNWHTDGYYNDPQHRIKAFALHCVREAASGGDSLFADHEMIYLTMREHNRALVEAMFRPDAMAIPVNAVDKDKLREEQIGPVFWQDPVSASLQMRYTARTRSICWNEDELVQEAKAFIADLLKDARHVRRYKLQAGEGVVANNCLHARESFRDNSGEPAVHRLLLRARFFDRTDSSCGT